MRAGSEMTGPVALTLAGISKRFGATLALRPLELEVPAGRILALLGPSGCGKTTTLRVIAGFEVPDSGAVLLGGRDVTELPPNRRGLGMVFQNYSLFPHMSVAENVAFGLRMRRLPRAERDARVQEMLEVVRLPGYGDRYAHQLSGGQQQRVALARALITRPAVLLLDEPLGALDKALREGMQFELRELQRRFGITTILVTHDQEEALTMSDSIAVMSAGEVVQTGTPREVYERPRTRFVAEFLGTANVFAATVTGAAPGGWAVRLDGADAAAALATPEPPQPGRRILFAVRPERLRIQPAGAGIPATVRDAVFRGSYLVHELAVPGLAAPVFVYGQAGAADAPPGAAVGLAWRAEDAVPLADPP